jgi:hypothetical protein
VLAAVALLVAAGVAVVGVLRPQRDLGPDEEELESFPRFPMLGATRTEIQGRMLRTVTDEVVPAERHRNDQKARLTKVSAFSLGVGLLGIAAQAGPTWPSRTRGVEMAGNERPRGVDDRPQEPAPPASEPTSPQTDSPFAPFKTEYGEKSQDPPSERGG